MACWINYLGKVIGQTVCNITVMVKSILLYFFIIFRIKVKSYFTLYSITFSNTVNVTFQAQHFCQMYLPAITVTELEVSVGRAMLLRKQSNAVWLSMWDCILNLSIYSVTNGVTVLCCPLCGRHPAEKLSQHGIDW